MLSKIPQFFLNFLAIENIFILILVVSSYLCPFTALNVSRLLCSERIPSEEEPENELNGKNMIDESIKINKRKYISTNIA